MKKFSKEVQIALVAIVGIVVLYVGMQFLKGLPIFSTDRNYYVRFNDISGLSVSSPIYANGYRVGVVEDVIYDYDHQDKIVAVIGLNNEMRLPKGSSAEIASDLLGNIKLELVLGPNPSDFLQPGDTISGGLQQGIMGLAAGMVPQIQAMLPKLDSILMNVNLLLSDPALKNSLHHIDQITGNLTTTTNELNSMAVALNRQMPSLIKNADGMLANANDLTRNLNELDLAATMAKVNNTLQNVEQMTAKLNSNEGTLGLLMRDPQLYNNLNATMMHADSLMIDLKAHPKRYVHFSVFGKKDK
ncbi:MAG: MCE family protein [Prevotella sp.]|nr:MCE family protein [Prevotella sp.]